MNFRDLLVIYLTLGSPLAAYYFFQNRKELNQPTLIFNTLLILTVWIPYAVKLISKYFTILPDWRFFGRFEQTGSDLENLKHYEKIFTDCLLTTGSAIGVYEFREVFERYVGLTSATRQADISRSANEAELEFCMASGRRDPEISAQCLHRRNFNLLIKHQQAAANDLLGCFGELLKFPPNRINLPEKVQSFLESIGDRQTLDSFQQGLTVQESELSSKDLPAKRLAVANR